MASRRFGRRRRRVIPTVGTIAASSLMARPAQVRGSARRHQSLSRLGAGLAWGGSVRYILSRCELRERRYLGRGGVFDFEAAAPAPNRSCRRLFARGAALLNPP